MSALGWIGLVEAFRLPLVGGLLLIVGLTVQTGRQRVYPAVASLALLVALSATKVLRTPEAWGSLAVQALSLAAIAGAFLLGSKLRWALEFARLNLIGAMLLGAGLVASVVAPSKGFILNRLLTIGALLLFAGSRRLGLDPARIGLVLVVAGLQFLQGSRASALLVLLVAAWFGLMQMRARGRAQGLSASVLAFAGTGAVLAGALALEPIRRRVFNDGRIVEGVYLADRNRLAGAAVRTLFQHSWSPFFGARVGSFRYVDKLDFVYPYPHDIALQSVLDFGIVIGIMIAAGILRAYRRCLRLCLGGTAADRGVTAVALGLGLLTLFNGTYIDYRFAALWLGAALAGFDGRRSIGGELR